MQSLIARLFLLCLLLAPSAGSWAEEQPNPSRQAGPGSVTHLLSLALLVADNDGSNGGDPLPVPVAKAVADIKDFLPYKHYRMHDAVVVRTANLENTRVELQGPDSRAYVGLLRYQVDGKGTKLDFSQFVLIQVHGPGVPRPPGPGREAGRDETPAPSASREVISTGFSISVGETIVVGTSRLPDSGKALVVVLTALPSK